MLIDFGSRYRYWLLVSGLFAMGVSILAIPNSSLEEQTPDSARSRVSESGRIDPSVDKSGESNLSSPSAKASATAQGGMLAYVDEDGNPAPPPPGYQFPIIPKGLNKTAKNYRLKSLPGGAVVAIPESPMLSYSSPRVTADGKLEFVCSKTAPPELSQDTIQALSGNEGKVESGTLPPGAPTSDSVKGGN